LILIIVLLMLLICFGGSGGVVKWWSGGMHQFDQTSSGLFFFIGTAHRPLGWSARFSESMPRETKSRIKTEIKRGGEGRVY